MASSSRVVRGNRLRSPQVILRAAAEEGAAEAEEGTSSSPEETSSTGSPLERARAALEEADNQALSDSLQDLEAELSSLNERLAAAEARVSGAESTVTTAKEQYLRLNADFDNFRKRTAAEKDQISSRVKGDVVADLLPLVDNFELARTQVKAETEAEVKINNSYQSLYKQMVDIMRSLGVEAVPTVGGLFDPELHEAIMKEPDDSVPDGSVILEFRKGFKLGERLLRPALVKVSSSDLAAPAVAPEDGAVAEEVAEEEVTA